MRVAAVQAEPVWMDLDGGVEKVCRLIKEAGEKGCELVGFPEVFIPGYPHNVFTVPPDTEWVLEYQKNSLVLDSPQYIKIRKAVRDAGIWCVLGFSERENSTLYLAQSYFNPRGDVVCHRRKIKPTHAERWLYGDSNGPSVFNVVSTDKGVKVGALNCWEHIQPLLRYHEYTQGVEIHVASWPHMAASAPGIPFASTQEGCSTVCRNMAIEGTTFVLVSTQTTSLEGSKTMKITADQDLNSAGIPIEGGGFSAIYGPSGDLLAKAQDEHWEGLIIADLDLDDIHRSRQMADCAGHYSRPDLLSLNVNVDGHPKVRYSDGRHEKGFKFQDL